MVRAQLDWDALQRSIAGEVIVAGAPGYEAARKSAIPRFDAVRPLAVVRCVSAPDVAAAIAFATRSGLPAVPRSGGHCLAGRSSTRGVVIDVTPMRSISVSDGVATVGAGARLGDLYDALDAHGRTVPAGCGPTVGIAGLALGGGFGILGRSHGLTSDHLLGARVVLADGRVIECDEGHDSDLFWALRGAGGGQFGVVTSLTLRTIPAPSATSFRLEWPAAAAAAAVSAWQAWAPDAPDELAASLLLIAGADVAEPPTVVLQGAVLADEGAAAAMLDEFVCRVGANPATASLSCQSYRETKRRLVQLGEADDLAAPEHGHPYSKSEYFARSIPGDAITALAAHLGHERLPGQARILDFTPWGGAYNRVPADASAFAHRDQRFLFKQEVIVAPTASDGERETARRWLHESWSLVHPWGSGRVYPNFPDPDLAAWAAAYHGENLGRLLRVKARYDPTGCFRFPPSRLGAPAAPAGPTPRTPALA